MKKKTKETRAIEKLLKENFSGYPDDCPPEAYRHNSVSIRVRLVHDEFRDMTRSAREQRVLPVIRTLPDATQQDITVLLLLAPGELDRSMMNVEFEHPVTSRI